MSFRIEFSGDIRKSETKNLGGKQMVEIQLCQKNYAKQGDEATFTWLRVAVWEPKDFQLPQLQAGCFIAGSGEFSLRSYVNKDGVKQQSAEVRCGSFDVSGPRQAAASAPAPMVFSKPRVPVGGGNHDDGPPFARPLIAEVWG